MPLPHCALPGPPARPPPTLPVSHADPPCGHDAHRAGPWPGPEPQHLALCAHVWPGPSSPHASPSPPDTSLLSNCSPACGMPSSAHHIAPHPGPAAGLPPHSSDPAGALGSSALTLRPLPPPPSWGCPRARPRPAPPGPTASQARAASISPSCLSPHQSPWPLQAQLPHRARSRGLRDNLALLAWHSRPLAWPG